MSGIAFYFSGFPVCTVRLLRHKMAQKGGGMDRNRTFFPFGGAAGCNLYHPLSAVCRPLSAARPSGSTLGTGISGCPAGGPPPPGKPTPSPSPGGVPRWRWGADSSFSVWPGKISAPPLRRSGGPPGWRALPRSSPSWRPCSAFSPWRAVPFPQTIPSPRKKRDHFRGNGPAGFIRFSASVRMLWPAPPALQSWAGVYR